MFVWFGVIVLIFVIVMVLILALILLCLAVWFVWLGLVVCGSFRMTFNFDGCCLFC